VFEICTAPTITPYRLPIVGDNTRNYGDGVDGAPNGIERAKMVIVINPSEGKPSMGKSIRNLAAVTRVGLDLAKKVFQRCYGASGEGMAPSSR
jgi:hypothetical protein